MNARHSFLALSVLLGSLLAPTASAVSLTTDGRGQVLLYPYYTAQGTTDTLISVVNPTLADAVNPTFAAKALKLRFLEGRNGRPVLDLNLYLSSGDSWAAVLTRDAVGNPILRAFDASCTVPAMSASPTISGAREVPLGNGAYANYDRAGSGLDRAREGYVEILEMGEVDPAFNLPGVGTMGAAISRATRNCAALAAGWTPGGIFTTSSGAELSPPKGGLIGSATLINVEQGTDYSYDPVALAAVFATKNHTPPGSASPNLGEASPSSLVVVDGEAIRSTWSRGIDAVSAVLMHRTVLNEYTVDQGLNASTDVVLTFPTKPFLVALESDTSATTRAPFYGRFDDMAPAGPGATGPLLADGASAGACEWMSLHRDGRDGELNSLSADFGFIPPVPQDPGSICWTANVISFGNVLGSMNAIPIDSHPSTRSGTIYVSFPYTPQVLTSIDAHRHLGLPVIGFAVQKYVNGALALPSTGTVLSNYGGAFAHKYVTEVQ